MTTANLAGDVVDPSGAAIPDVSLTVRNTATGATRTETSDAKGHFVFLALTPGDYSLVAQRTGFKKSDIEALTLTVGETQAVRVVMQVGAVVQTVKVSATAAVIATTQAAVGSTMQPLQIESLPLNQRSFTALVTQQAGMVQMTNTTPATVLSAATNTGSMISAQGSMGSSIAYLMDGVNFSNGSMTAPGTAAAGDMPGVEAMQEFKVLTHDFSARYGGASSTVVSFATRSGTNNIHGSVYDYLRNDVFDARSFFDAQKPPFKRNQFGAALGGPIQKNKTFYFANYEGLRQRLTTTSIAYVPTDCARNGGVGGTCNFPVVGPSGPVAISPGIRSILNLYPEPTGPELFPGSGIAPSAFLNYQPTRQDFGVVKLDHQLTSKDHVSVRYQITDADATQDFNLPSFTFLRADRDQNVMLQWSRMISPQMVNTLSFSFLRTNLHSSTQAVKPLLPSQYTGDPSRKTIGVITVGSGTAGTSSGTLTELGLDDASPFHLAENDFPVNDDLVYSTGRHTFHFGGMVDRMQWNWTSSTIPGGSYTFLTLNDLLAGNPEVLLIHRNGVDTSYRIRTTAIAWYAEDAWQATRRLTLTVGLRHDFQVPILSDANGRLGSWPSPTATSIRTGTPYNNYSLTQFQPRIGLAWDVFGNGKTVVRSGYGLYNDFINFATNAQGILQWNAPGPALNTFFGEPAAPGFLPVIPFPTCTACTQPTTFAGLVTGMMLPVNSPTANQWDLQIQQTLPWHLNLTTTYSGAQSYHIPRKAEENYNLPCSSQNGAPVFPAVPGQCGTGAPGIAGIGFSLYSRLYDTTSNYNAFTLQVNRSFANNFLFQTSYTFAKAMSESDAFNSGNFMQGVAQASVYPANPAFDRSESVYSIRHRFTENFVWNIPVGRGQHFLGQARGAANVLLGGWQISSLATVQSGIPFTVFAGVPISGVGDNIDFPDRPNLLSTNTVHGGPDNYLNPKAYALQPYGHLGTAPRTSARGPGFADVDLSIGKKFTLTERTGLQFRADFFNLLNHPNFALPFNQIYTGVPQFGSMPTQAQLDALPCNLTASQSLQYSCNPQAGKISSIVGVPREMQFSLKLEF